jgi:hypothetical protein
MPVIAMRYTLHCFRPGETIDAVLRLLGRHNLTHDELLVLREQFNVLNASALPRPGMTFKIPLPADDVGKHGPVWTETADERERDSFGF